MPDGSTPVEEAQVIVCPRCSKENQDHYKFCLGCGSELPRDAAKKDFAAPTSQTDPPAAPAPEKHMQFAATQQGDVSFPPPAAQPAPAPLAATMAEASLAPIPRPAPAPAPAAAPTPSAAVANNCPSCGNPVPTDFKFCGTCGHRMDGAPAPAPAPAAAPALAPAPAPAPAAQARGTLVLINPDGTEGATFQLHDGSTQVGRNAGGIFAADAYMSPVHATFVFQGNKCSVRDEGSLNGVYVKIGRDQPVRLGDGDVFRIGQEIVRYEEIGRHEGANGVEIMGSPNPGFIGRLCLVIGRETTGNSYTIPADGLHIGRERGDVIFPEDGYVSGLHCRVHRDASGTVLTDVGSSNGTFVRVRDERAVAAGELLLMGQQLFRLDY